MAPKLWPTTSVGVQLKKVFCSNGAGKGHTEQAETTSHIKITALQLFGKK